MNGVKIIFLDCDGVLNSTSYKIMMNKKGLKPEFHCLDPEAVENLNLIIDAVPDVKFVLTSVWRIGHTTDWLYEKLKKAGFRHANPFIGKTSTNGFSMSNKLGIRYEENGRGLEIAEFLAEYSVENDIFSFVIVDDSSDMWKLINRLARISNMYGLTDRNAMKIVEMLNQKLDIKECIAS